MVLFVEAVCATWMKINPRMEHCVIGDLEDIVLCTDCSISSQHRNSQYEQMVRFHISRVLSTFVLELTPMRRVSRGIIGIPNAGLHSDQSNNKQVADYVYKNTHPSIGLI